MDEQLKTAFDAIQTPERLKRAARATIRRKTFDYGRNLLRLRIHRRRLAAGLLSLALMVSAAGLWFFPSASISVDVNPSIELKVNALDRVICLKGKNSDGIRLVQDIDVTGMEYDDAMQRVLLSNGMEPYLQNGSAITITVVGDSKSHGTEMLSRVLCRAYNIAKEENVLYCQVDRETVRAAQAVNLCIPRYLAWQHLLETDPTVTVEDVRQLSKDEIHVLAQVMVLDNPCGE